MLIRFDFLYMLMKEINWPILSSLFSLVLSLALVVIQVIGGHAFNKRRKIPKNSHKVSLGFQMCHAISLLRGITHLGVLLKAGPRPTARYGPAARRPDGPVLIFHSFFCPAVNPCACTDLHRVWACKMNDGEFEFVYHFNNHFNPFGSFLLLHGSK